MSSMHLHIRMRLPVQTCIVSALQLQIRHLWWALRSVALCCLQKNFDKPVEWGLIKDHAWSTPQLRKLDTPVSCHAAPAKTCSNFWLHAADRSQLLMQSCAVALQVDVDGKPWPLDTAGKLVLKT
jgi:hypothetical protein